MANPDTPNGLRPVKDINGKCYTGTKRSYNALATYATALFIGDPVKIVGTASTLADGRIVSDIQAAATGDVIDGVIVGFAASPTDLSSTYRAASTAREVFVCDSNDMLYEVQEGSSGTALAAADLGLNIDFVVAAGSTTTGLSGVMINNATEATTNTLDLKLVEFVNRPDNVIGYSAKWLVKLNRHRFANQVAGV